MAGAFITPASVPMLCAPWNASGTQAPRSYDSSCSLSIAVQTGAGLPVVIAIIKLVIVGIGNDRNCSTALGV